MRWPKEILDVVSWGLDIEPKEGYRREEVFQALLDETARRLVWRCKGDPANVSGCLRWPYTPLGSVINEGIGGRVLRLSMDGSRWGQAVDEIHGFIEANAAAVCEAYRDQGTPYPDRF
jgi:hypothetical protein